VPSLAFTSTYRVRSAGRAASGCSPRGLEVISHPSCVNVESCLGHVGFQPLARRVHLHWPERREPQHPLLAVSLGPGRRSRSPSTAGPRTSGSRRRTRTARRSLPSDLEPRDLPAVVGRVPDRRPAGPYRRGELVPVPGLARIAVQSSTSDPSNPSTTCVPPDNSPAWRGCFHFATSSHWPEAGDDPVAEEPLGLARVLLDELRGLGLDRVQVDVRPSRRTRPVDLSPLSLVPVRQVRRRPAGRT
jgi:hypothetical protein